MKKLNSISLVAICLATLFFGILSCQKETGADLVQKKEVSPLQVNQTYSGDEEAFREAVELLDETKRLNVSFKDGLFHWTPIEKDAKDKTFEAKAPVCETAWWQIITFTECCMEYLYGGDCLMLDFDTAGVYQAYLVTCP